MSEKLGKNFKKERGRPKLEKIFHHTNPDNLDPDNHQGEVENESKAAGSTRKRFCNIYKCWTCHPNTRRLTPSEIQAIKSSIEQKPRIRKEKKCDNKCPFCQIAAIRANKYILEMNSRIEEENKKKKLENEKNKLKPNSKREPNTTEEYIQKIEISTHPTIRIEQSDIAPLEALLKAMEIDKSLMQQLINNIIM